VATVSPSPTERLRALGIELPPPPTPKGSYAPVVRAAKLAWVSGQIVFESGAVVRPGAVDRDVSADDARELVRRATLQALSALAANLGKLEAIRRVARIGVFVAVSPGFHREHEVANGGSDLLLELFGEAGRASRTTVGVAGLPLNAPVEVELLVETD
jgi:enamine deaminase RidA (YjgF/YER057c/UK114 family)